MNVDRTALPFFEALASQTRLAIVEMLFSGDKNIQELSKELGLSTTIVARHIKQLEEADIIATRKIPGKHGIQKACHLLHSSMLLTFMSRNRFPSVMNFEIPVGSYVDWQVTPPCGMEFGEHVFTQSIHSNQARFFADPRRNDAGIIWLTHGYLEYAAPNYIQEDQQLSEIHIQLELGSEAPGYSMDWPSDIYFLLNGKPLGFWTVRGDFGDRGGMCSPDWPRGFSSKYGSLVQISVGTEGTFINRCQTSDITIRDIPVLDQPSFRFRVESPENAANPRGFNIFGKGFGDFGQNILFSTFSIDKEGMPTELSVRRTK